MNGNGYHSVYYRNTGINGGPEAKARSLTLNVSSEGDIWIEKSVEPFTVQITASIQMPEGHNIFKCF